MITGITYLYLYVFHFKGLSMWSVNKHSHTFSWILNFRYPETVENTVKSEVINLSGVRNDRLATRLRFHISEEVWVQLDDCKALRGIRLKILFWLKVLCGKLGYFRSFRAHSNSMKTEIFWDSVDIRHVKQPTVRPRNIPLYQIVWNYFCRWKVKFNVATNHFESKSIMLMLHHWYFVNLGRGRSNKAEFRQMHSYRWLYSWLITEFVHHINYQLKWL